MITVILQQIILLTVFLIASIFLFTYPGLGILKLLKIRFPGRLDLYAISTILGLCSFTLVTYILSLLHIRNFIWAVILLGFFIAIKHREQIRPALTKIKEKFFSLLTLIFITGILATASINAASGLTYSQGLLFWSAHGHDGIWHVALIEQMKEQGFERYL